MQNQTTNHPAVSLTLMMHQTIVVNINMYLLTIQYEKRLTCDRGDPTAITCYTEVTRGYNLHFTH